jgi:hypothetical protein
LGGEPLRRSNRKSRCPPIHLSWSRAARHGVLLRPISGSVACRQIRGSSAAGSSSSVRFADARGPHESCVNGPRSCAHRETFLSGRCERLGSAAVALAQIVLSERVSADLRGARSRAKAEARHVRSDRRRDTAGLLRRVHVDGDGPADCRRLGSSGSIPPRVRSAAPWDSARTRKLRCSQPLPAAPRALAPRRSAGRHHARACASSRWRGGRRPGPRGAWSRRTRGRPRARPRRGGC